MCCKPRLSILRREGIRQLPEICWYFVECGRFPESRWHRGTCDEYPSLACLLYTSNREIAETLDIGWELLSILPESELKRIKPEMIEKYGVKKEK